MKKPLFRSLCAVLLLLLALSMTGCGASAPAATPEPTPEATPVPTPEPTPEPTPMPTVQSVEIQYAGKRLDDFTMKVGEIVTLRVAVQPSDLPIEVIWSTDPEGESAFEFHPLEADPAGCEVVCIGPLPADSGGVRLYAQVYGGKAGCMVHVTGGGAARGDQTVEIYYPLEDRVLTNFQMYIGESIELQARPLSEGSEGTVVWSMSDSAATALRFVEDKTDPWKVTLECFQALPAGTARVNIYAELDGVKTGCVVYVK